MCVYDTICMKWGISLNLITVKNLIKTYKVGKVETEVLRGLDFSIQEKEFVSLIGPSGSGKTTLLYVLGGLEDYQKGSIEIFNKELSSYTDQEKGLLRSHQIGFVFQFYNLIPNLTAYENVELASVIGKQKSKEQIENILDLVGMKDYMHHYPSQLSGGMQQRISIARALINDPLILFADEPTGNLDLKNSHKIMELFKELNERLNLTILMVTHNEDLTSYGTRTLHMLDGKVIKDETKSK